MRVALGALIVVLLTAAAAAQYTFDAKGRRYECLPGDWGCTVLPPPGAPLQPLPAERRRPVQPPVPCGTRCDPLDRMK
jgi:hypothetical protein